MKTYAIAGGIIAGVAGAVLLKRQQTSKTSGLKRAGKLLVVGILGRGLIIALVKRLVKKSLSLGACRIHLKARGAAHAFSRINLFARKSRGLAGAVDTAANAASGR